MFKEKYEAGQWPIMKYLAMIGYLTQAEADYCCSWAEQPVDNAAIRTLGIDSQINIASGSLS